MLSDCSTALTGQLDHYAKSVMPNYPNNIVSQGKREIDRLREAKRQQCARNA